MRRVVVDTNVFISVILGSKSLLPLYKGFMQNRFTLIVSLYLLNEIKHVLTRREFGLSAMQIEKIITYLRIKSEIVHPEKKITICRDPKDNPILECACAGKADYIVTGDKDLLSLQAFERISIVTPKMFLEIM